MAKEGLTTADQAKLLQESVNTHGKFKQLRDQDFAAFGIDIAARRARSPRPLADPVV